jgi:hypothetical protein
LALCPAPVLATAKLAIVVIVTPAIEKRENFGQSPDDCDCESKGASTWHGSVRNVVIQSPFEMLFPLIQMATRAEK